MFPCSSSTTIQFAVFLKFWPLKGLERKWVSSLWYSAYFSRRLVLWFATVYRRRRRKFRIMKVWFSAEFSCLYLKINFVAEFLDVQKLWLFTLLTLPSYRLCIYLCMYLRWCIFQLKSLFILCSCVSLKDENVIMKSLSYGVLPTLENTVEFVIGVRLC